MASYRYDPLASQDASFLWTESPSTPMHIGVLFIADAGPLRNPAGGIDIGRIRSFIYSRLHRIPRYRQRILFTPLRGRAVWVDDDHFNLEYHVRHTALPRPGTREQLKPLIGRIASTALDRARPLWELWVIEGLEDGERFALISKVHHCMTDGVSGAELMTVMMSLSPQDEPGPLVAYMPRPLPSAFELRRDDLLDLVGGPMHAVEPCASCSTPAAAASSARRCAAWSTSSRAASFRPRRRRSTGKPGRIAASTSSRRRSPA